MKHFVFLAANVAAALAACTRLLPVSAFSLPPHSRPQIRWKHARRCSELPTRRTAGILLEHGGSGSRLLASKTDGDSESRSNSISDDNDDQKDIPNNTSSTRAATMIALGAFLAVEIATPFPSQATSFGQFGASISPPKTAVAIARDSSAVFGMTKSGTPICQPVSAISALNSNLSIKCKLSELAPSEEPMSEQAVAHQKLMAELEQEPDLFIYFAAFLASTISTLIMHPLDTWKVRVMTKSQNEEEEVSNTGTVDTSATSSTIDGSQSPSLSQPLATSSPPLESSTALSATSIPYNDQPMPTPLAGFNPRQALGDFRSLYDGILPNIVKEGPPSALYLGLYESSIVLLKQYPFFTDHKIIMYLLAGAIGEVAGSIVRAPAEAVKTRVQAGHTTLGDAFRTVFFTEEGRQNTYQAWSSSIFRDVPAGAIQIAIFEALKLFLIDASYVAIDPDTLVSECILGGIGGAIGTYVTTPFDRLTTMIISSGDENLSMLDAAKKIWSEQGAEGFLVGSRERASYWFLAVGIFLGVYCFLRQAGIPLFVDVDLH